MTASSHVSPGRTLRQGRELTGSLTATATALPNALWRDAGERVSASEQDEHLGCTSHPVQAPDDATITSLTQLFDLLSNPTRLRILLALQTAGDALRAKAAVSSAAATEWCVCDLASFADASASMTSHQLRLLRDAGLVAHRRVGKHILYRLAPGPLSHLLADGLRHARLAAQR